MKNLIIVHSTQKVTTIQIQVLKMLILKGIKRQLQIKFSIHIKISHRYLGEIRVETSARRGSIPLTEDGYAMLELERSMELGYNNTGSQNETNHVDQNEGKINVISDHYEVSENFKLNKHDHDYEEPYWEPANKEEELMDQLSKLGVPQVLTESIEYVGF